MLNPYSKAIMWAAIAALAAAGCGSHTMANSPSDRLAFERRAGADEGKATAFVNALAALPPTQRGPYMQAHPADVANLAKIPDPELQQKFDSLVRRHG
jgi:hypothetical protein